MRRIWKTKTILKNASFGHEVTCYGAWSIRGPGVVKLNFAVEKLNFAVERLNFAVVTKTPKIHQILEQIEHLSIGYRSISQNHKQI